MSEVINSRQRNRNRLLLLVIFAVFFGGAILAGALRFTGWKPEGMKNHGELLQPPGDLRKVVPHLADGGEYRWEPAARRWRIAVAAPVGCAEVCVGLAHQLDVVWQLFGRDADHVDILWIGTPPPAGAKTNAATRVLRDDPALRAALPRLDAVSNADTKEKKNGMGLPVYVIDPNGFVILRYAPGADPGDLRADMSKLLKLM